MRKLLEKVQRLQNRADYADTYVDSVELLFVGIVFGILGGIWGNLINDYLSNLFGDAYIGLLSVMTLVVLYWLSYPIRRARRMVKENFDEIKDIQQAIVEEENRTYTPNTPDKSEVMR